MANDVPTGTAPSVQPVNVMTAPAEPQAPQVQTPQPPSIPSGGKTVEQLAQELEAQNDIIREAQDRLARMEHERELERQVYSNLNADRRPKQEDVPEVPQVSDEEYLTNPAKATSKIVEGYFARERKEREQERATQYVGSARTAYETGKAEALKANPNLFKGIDGEISREILNNIQSSFRAGQPVDPEVLRNPRYYEAAALAYRVMNGEDVSRYYNRTPTPMSPGHTETPTVGSPPKDEMTLSPEQEELILKGHITREAFMKAWAFERSKAEEKKR